jgi:hypothetical protein
MPRISIIVSTILWILGFVLCFFIPGGSQWSWIADFLLLLGFFPLLWLYPAGWTWLVFGILNVAIGIILEIGYHIPAESFTKDVNRLRLTLQATHPTLVWILTGLACTIFGVLRMIKNAVVFFRRAKKHH